MRVCRFALVDEGRVARDDEEAVETAERGKDVLGQTVSKEFLLGVAAHVFEGQHNDRRLVGKRRRRHGCASAPDSSPSGTVDGHPEDTDRPGDVLNFDLAHVIERNIELIAHLVAGCARDTDAARISQGLNPRGHVHPVAVDVVALNDHIAQIDADPEFDAPLLGHTGITLSHAALDRDGAFHRIDDAAEFDQGAIAHQLDDTPTVAFDLGVDEFGPVRLQGIERTDLVLAHQAAVADHVGTQDSGKPAFHTVPCHESAPLTRMSC